MVRAPWQRTTDPAMAPPGMHAASAYAYAFPVDTPRDQHGHLKNEMAEGSAIYRSVSEPSSVAGPAAMAGRASPSFRATTPDIRCSTT